MRRTSFILALTIVLVLGAGVVVGRLWANLPAISHGDEKPDWATDVLKLTPDQKKQFDAIWAEVHLKVDETFEQRKALDHEHDQAISALLSPEQFISYEEIQQEYRDGRGNLDKARQKLVQDAEKRCKALLNDEQVKRWEQLPHRPHPPGHGPSSGPGGPGPDFGFVGPPPLGPSSRPAHMEHSFGDH